VPEADAFSDAVAAFRAHLDRLERGDIAGAPDDYTEDAVLVADPGGGQGLLLAGTFRGRAEIGGWIANWFSSFESGSYRFKFEKAIEKGDRVFLTVFHTARGAGSGADVELRVHHVFTARRGLIARHAFSTVRDTMLRAAGIESAEAG